MRISRHWQCTRVFRAHARSRTDLRRKPHRITHVYSFFFFLVYLLENNEISRAIPIAERNKYRMWRAFVRHHRLHLSNANPDAFFITRRLIRFPDVLPDPNEPRSDRIHPAKMWTRCKNSWETAYAKVDKIAVGCSIPRYSRASLLRHKTIVLNVSFIFFFFVINSTRQSIYIVNTYPDELGFIIWIYLCPDKLYLIIFVSLSRYDFVGDTARSLKITRRHSLSEFRPFLMAPLWFTDARVRYENTFKCHSVIRKRYFSRFISPTFRA